MFTVRKTVYSAICVALGIILPIALHSVPNAGLVLLPMHLPVLLCGLITGFPYGLICGLVTPALSGVLTGMPPAAVLPSMICELAVYGLCSSLLIRFVRTRNSTLNLVTALIGSMLAGRIVFGALNAMIFSTAKEYTLNTWLTASFVTCLPGIGAQLVLIPLMVFVLKKAKLAPQTH